METEIQAKPLNPWFSTWVKPRETMRWIVDTDPTRQVVLLAVLGGIAQFLDRACQTLQSTRRRSSGHAGHSGAGGYGRRNGLARWIGPLGQWDDTGRNKAVVLDR